MSEKMMQAIQVRQYGGPEQLVKAKRKALMVDVVKPPLICFIEDKVKGKAIPVGAGLVPAFFLALRRCFHQAI